jgi:hypothetical protein
MSESFDYYQFDRDAGLAFAHSVGLGFCQAAEAIDQVRHKYKGIRDSGAKQYIRFTLDTWLFRAAMHTSQPFNVGDRFYTQMKRWGFPDMGGEMVLSMLYADYCNDNGQLGKGLRNLNKIRDKVRAVESISEQLRQKWLREIDKVLKRLGKGF